MSSGRYKVGWLLFDDPRRHADVSSVDTYIRMRYLGIARELHAAGVCQCEPYTEGVLYDAIVVTKLGLREFDHAEAVVRTHKEHGKAVLFDLNVNYLEDWGEHTEAYLKPKPRHLEHAHFMCKVADVVVADSAYLATVASRYSRNVHVVTDNIAPEMFRDLKRHGSADPLTIGWCGVSVKSYHLSIVDEVLSELSARYPIRLLLISNEPPRFVPGVEYEYRPYHYDRFPADILECDLGISPKVLNNAYELGHTEFKVTTFMAQGVPVVASPQPSYLQAVRHGESGFIASTGNEWRSYLEQCLADASLRNRLGLRAREDVLKRYATEVVARRYAAAIRSALGEAD